MIITIETTSAGYEVGVEGGAFHGEACPLRPAVAIPPGPTPPLSWSDALDVAHYYLKWEHDSRALWRRGAA